ncbi:unnamed protein product [Cuscuta europaea]|uniref:Uncharacterized protein n=1 Tax=Cuscuta europaea TaxID=41803 RepID=A0A9P0YU95_CUSEU|nr:unnamed protein product [Cuscuta europaea]
MPVAKVPGGCGSHLPTS